MSIDYAFIPTRGRCIECGETVRGVRCDAFGFIPMRGDLGHRDTCSLRPGFRPLSPHAFADRLAFEPEPVTNVEVPHPAPYSFPVVREEYVTEALAWGFFCRRCGAFTGDAKEFHVTCRCCGAPRPKHDHVARFTRGK